MTIACAVGRHDGPPSIEHIIPEAVGGVLKTRCVCETCNNNECAKIDAALADDPIVLLHRFKYKTPGWETVKDKVLGRGTMEDGTKVVVRFDEAEGIFKPTVLGGQKSETKNLDGTATISFTLSETPTPARLLELANREYRRRNEPEITLEQLPSRMTITPIEIAHPTARHELVCDLVGLNLAGLKIAYEFVADTIGASYLVDPFADRARDLLIAGVPRADDPVRVNFDALGTLTYVGTSDELPIRGPSAAPGHVHLICLQVEANRLLVVMRIFDALQGVYVLSHNAARFGLREGPVRVHSVDVVAKRGNDIRIQGNACA